MSVLFPSSPPAPPSPAVQSVPASSGPPSWNSIDPVPRPSPPQAAPGATAFNTENQTLHRIYHGPNKTNDPTGLPPTLNQVYKGIWIGSHKALRRETLQGCGIANILNTSTELLNPGLPRIR